MKRINIKNLILTSALALIPVSSILATQWEKELTPDKHGINLQSALEYIKQKGLEIKETITVGIIDSGLDTANRDIKPALWVNPEEMAGGDNGYKGDINGWNFLGTQDGSFNMTSAGTEEYREFKRLYPKYKNVDPANIADTAEYAYYLRMRKKAGIDSYLKYFEFYKLKDLAYARIDSAINSKITASKRDTLTIHGLSSVLADATNLDNDFAAIGTDIVKAGGSTPWQKLLSDHTASFSQMKNRIIGIERDADKRLLMGDNLKDETDIYYGNPQLCVDGCDHGTFVAGVIAGQGVNDPNITGIFPQAKLMIIRAVPEGDEYDKDVATSIRYAVDNGAKVVNLSLGKMTSPDSAMVNRAIEYALAKDVLIVQAAGNTHQDLDPIGYYPSAFQNDGTRFGNFIRVGASDIKGNISPISNYGATKVDIFAPGDDIRGCTVNNEFQTSSGTSIATPVVAAVAAMIRAYFPSLKATEVKQILIESCRPYRSLSALCVSGGIIDAANAIKLAANRERWNRATTLQQENLEKLMEGRTPYCNWIEGSSSFYYDIKDNNGINFYIVDAKSGKKRRMIRDYTKFIADCNRILNDSAKCDKAEVYGIDFANGKTDAFTFKKKGKVLRYDIGSGKLRLATEKEIKIRDRAKGKVYPKYSDADSPDSTFSILGCNYDLMLRRNATGEVKRITFDGKEDASHTYRCKPDTSDKNACGFWAGMRYIQLLHDQSSILRTGLIHSVGKKRPEADVYRMPMPGDTGVKQTRILWFNPETEEVKYLPIEKYKDQVVDLNYAKNDSHLFFTRRSRKGDYTDLCRINLKDGTVTELISDYTEPHGNLSLFNYRILNNGKEFIWWSERTGRGNYYLYDSEGRLKNRITHGDSLVAGPIARIDTVGRTIVFEAYGNESGQNPYYKHFYSAKLDGSQQNHLTPADATHELSISPCGRYAIDKHSRTNIPPRYAAITISKPSTWKQFEQVDISPIEAVGYKAPSMFSLKACDGVTDLYGIIYTPSNLDRTKKYPVISNVYPGPQDDQIPRGFVLDDNYNQSLAELGFIVICAPSRGSSPLRGRDFYTYGYGNMRDYPLADDKHTIETLASHFPFMDIDRVGIYGHSGGGFQTAAAILTYPDFYKVAIAASGNHDNNIYIQNWGEAFHGIKEVTDSVSGKTHFECNVPTNMQLASNLKGKLLLVHGDIDKNVSPSHTLRLADALIKSGKYFDMMIMPNKDHGLNSDFYTNLIRKYFLEHLLQEPVGN